MATGFGELKVFSGSAHGELAKEIAAFLGVPVGQARLRRFPDTEVSFQIDENIRGTDVFVVQPTCATANGSVDQHLMELMIMVDAFRRSRRRRASPQSSVLRIRAAGPQGQARVPISASGGNVSAPQYQSRARMDLHKAQIQGFFDIPVDHLFAAPVIIDYHAHLESPNLTLVAPDAGGAGQARTPRLMATRGHRQRRSDDGTAEVMNVIGDVEAAPASSGRHRRHRRDDYQGGDGASAARPAVARLCGARRAVRADRADREVPRSTR
jgi:ribose-phosphate pyrophosphokinase